MKADSFSVNRAIILDRFLLRKVRDDANCRRLVMAPGTGAVVAAAAVAAILPSSGAHAPAALRSMTRRMPHGRLTELFDTKAAIRELAH
jgi:hypothetical protein